MKPIPLLCILRISKSQLVEKSFKDNIIETIYQLILEHATIESYKIYFPDLFIPCIIQVRKKDKNKINFRILVFKINLIYIYMYVCVYVCTYVYMYVFFLVKSVFEEMSYSNLL